jgi:hypothetical protein
MREIFSKKMKKKGLTKFEGCIILIINDFERTLRCPLFFNFLPIYRNFLSTVWKRKG